MRFILLLILSLFLLSSSTAVAQTSAVTGSPATPAPRPNVLPADTGAVLLFNGWYLPAYRANTPAADTTGALLSLFRKRRYAGFLFAVPFILGATLALPIASTAANGTRTVASEAISPPLGSAILLGTVVGFIAHATKFNKAHLVAVDVAYAAGRPIPRKYRSQLNASHFAEAVYLREAIAQQKARERSAAPR